MAATAGAGRLLVASDLDGCLLDHDTYSYEPARPALQALARARTPLVLCSSKTLTEMLAFSDVAGDPSPLVVENGGALAIPRGSLRHDPGGREHRGFRVVPLGAPRAELVEALRSIAREVGAELRGFASMEPAEVAGLTGLSPAAARHALEREHDEPFVADAGLGPALARAADARGLRITRGGRFFHITGRSDKGVALRKLLELHAAEGRSFSTVGLGDAANDVPLLRAVDRPVAVPGRDGDIDPALAAAVPEAERAPRPGPAGWNDAVLAVLEGRRLSKVRAA